jgi:hypothetical protein
MRQLVARQSSGLIDNVAVGSGEAIVRPLPGFIFRWPKCDGKRDRAAMLREACEVSGEALTPGFSGIGELSEMKAVVALKLQALPVILMIEVVPNSDISSRRAF